jgi:hypothetical protein
MIISVKKKQSDFEKAQERYSFSLQSSVTVPTIMTRVILYLETGHGGESNPGEEMEDVSAVLRFFFLVFFSFFATGNIASLNSFDPSSIR